MNNITGAKITDIKRVRKNIIHVKITFIKTFRT